MNGIGYFQNLRNFLGKCLKIFGIFPGIFWKFFRRIFWGIFFRYFLGEIFLEEFFGEDFLGGFFWRNFWEEFFRRNYLVEINNELMFLSRFWGNARRRQEI